MKVIKLIILIVLAVTITACSTSTGSLTSNIKFHNNENIDVENPTKLIEAVNKSGLKIFKQRVKNNSNGNVIVSPISIFSAFSLLSNGADGATKKQIDKAFYLDGFEQQDLNQSINSLMNKMNYNRFDENVGKINIYNSLWINNGFKIRSGFLNTAKSYYDSDMFERDFTKRSTLDDMNTWASEKSDSLINKPFDNLNGLSTIVLMNLLNFKGKWVSEFSKERTQEDNFYLKDKTAEKAMLMNKEAMMNYYEDNEVKSGVLNYYNGKMIILLPNGNIDEYINSLSMDKINSYSENASNSKVKLKLPKFDVEYKEDISEILKQLGIKNAFSPDNASFKSIHEDSQPLWMDKVLHDCVIKVDEEGTQGAALTAVLLYGAGLPKDTHELYINKPFVFLIQDNSGTCLFIGKIENIK